MFGSFIAGPTAHNILERICAGDDRSDISDQSDGDDKDFSTSVPMRQVAESEYDSSDDEDEDAVSSGAYASTSASGDRWKKELLQTRECILG